MTRVVPSMAIVPPSAGVRPNRTRASSVRPAPTRPASPTISPAPTRRLTPAIRAAAQPTSRMREDVSRLELRAAFARSELRRPRHAESEIDVTADHQPHHAVARDLADRQRRHQPAVAQHRDAIGEGHHFLEAMRDVDAADAVRPQLAHQGEQPRRLDVGEGGRRLVEQEHLGARAEGARDLDQLLLGHAQRPGRSIEVERDADPGQQLAGAGPAGAPVDAAEEAAVLQAEGQVLGDREVGQERRLLIDWRHAQAAHPRRVGPLDRLAADRHRAGIGPDGPGHHPDQRALAGPVLADQRVHLTGPDVEGHATHGLDAPEGDGDL